MRLAKKEHTSWWSELQAGSHTGSPVGVGGLARAISPLVSGYSPHRGVHVLCLQPRRSPGIYPSCFASSAEAGRSDPVTCPGGALGSCVVSGAALPPPLPTGFVSRDLPPNAGVFRATSDARTPVGMGLCRVQNKGEVWLVLGWRQRMRWTRAGLSPSVKERRMRED